MKKVMATLLRFIPLGMLAVLCGCARDTILPTPPIIEGWEYSEKPQVYNRENLFDYMNGKARSYLDYGFVRLDHVQFARPPAKPTIDVDVYDMGCDTGAFGIYSLERGQELPLHHKRRLGYMVGSARFFRKGRHYVTITSPDSSRETIEAVNTLSLYLESSVPGNSEQLPLLTVFPKEGSVTESEQYFAANLMGHDFMGGGFVARYEEKGNRFRLFLSSKDSPALAADAYQRLKRELSEHGKIVGEVREIGESAFLAQDPYIGNWLVSVANSHVAAAAGFHDEAVARNLLRQLVLNLSSFASVQPAELKGGR